MTWESISLRANNLGEFDNVRFIPGVVQLSKVYPYGPLRTKNTELLY
jgi:hypothetical protein